MTRLTRAVAIALCAAALVLLSATWASGAVPSGDWPTYLHDVTRTSDDPNETIASPTDAAKLIKLWSFPTNGAAAASPTIVGDIAYAGSWDGYLYAINAITGAQKWKTFLDQTQTFCFSPVGITSSATVLNGTVYVGGGDGYFYALAASSGSILWKVFIGDNSASSGHYIFANPLIYKAYAFVSVASFCDNPLVQGQLLQVSLATHRVLRVFNVVPDGQLGGGVWTSPSLDAATNTVFITTGNETDASQQYARAIIALDADTLAVKAFWQSPASPTVPDLDWGTTPILFTDASGQARVAATNKNGIVYAFDRNNIGAGPVWQRQIARAGPDPEAGDGSASSAAIGGGRLYVGGGATTINGGAYPGAVRALDPATGNVIWEHGAPGIVLPAVAYANGVGDRRGRLDAGGPGRGDRRRPQDVQHGRIALRRSVNFERTHPHGVV